MAYGRQSTKYHARKCECMGEKFDSEGEMRRWLFLLDAQSRGEIAGLRRQVRYELVPAQWEGWTEGKRAKTRCLERAVAYVADFAYALPDGTEVVEDFKGMRTPEYRLKRKLMLWLHGVRVREVSRPAEPVERESTE